MKKLEVVMKSSAFNTFREYAPRLGISEYDLSEVRLSPGFAVRERQCLYRGQEYSLDLLSRVKVEFAVLDEDAKPVAQHLLTMLAPDRIAISTVDEVISMSANVGPVDAVSRTERGASQVAPISH